MIAVWLTIYYDTTCWCRVHSPYTVQFQIVSKMANQRPFYCLKNIFCLGPWFLKGIEDISFA